MLDVSQHGFAIELARISVAAGAGGFNDKAIPSLPRERARRKIARVHPAYHRTGPTEQMRKRSELRINMVV